MKYDKKIEMLMKKYVIKSLLPNFKEAKKEVMKRKMILEIPKISSRFPKKERQKIVENEFLIKDGRDLIISGGGRICMFLILETGFEEEIKRIFRQRDIEQFKQLLYFLRKLSYYKLKFKDFNKEKLL